LTGAGDTDLDRRAKSPLPVTQPTERGSDLKEAMRRVQELEARQRQLLSQAQSRKRSPRPKPEPQAEMRSQVSGADLAESALIVARMEAQIARQIEEYNKRPRKTFVGARAAEVRYALYVEDWRQKIERIGNLNYPESARGRSTAASGSPCRSTRTARWWRWISSDPPDTKSSMPPHSASSLAAPYARFPADIPQGNRHPGDHPHLAFRAR